MALRQLNMQLSEEDVRGLFNYFDNDGSGVCEVREILAVLKAEPTVEESRWQRIGIGKQTLTPSREVHLKVPPDLALPTYLTYRATIYRATSPPPATPLTYYRPQDYHTGRCYTTPQPLDHLLPCTNPEPDPPDPDS